MTAQEGKTPRQKVFVRLLLLAVPVLVALALYGAHSYWQTHRFNQWVMEDAENLGPYPIVLFPEERRNEAGPDTALDAVLTSETLKGRLGVELTRSDYYRSYGSNDAWVKTLLITSKPGDPQAQRRIKLLHHLQQKNGKWKVELVQELAIP
jgi:hypothetical protein